MIVRVRRWKKKLLYCIKNKLKTENLKKILYFMDRSN